VNPFQPYLNPKRLLVDPCDRLRFSVPLLLLTILLNWSIIPLLSNGLSTGLIGTPSIPFLRGALRGAIDGSVTGTVEWLVLRKYIPNSRWIVANTIGTIIVFGGIATIGDILVESGQSLLNTQQHGSLAVSLLGPSPQIRFAARIIAAPLCLVTGLLQWIVLRPYVVSASWWIVLPLFSYSLSLCLTSLYYFGSAHLLMPLRLDFSAFLDTIDVLILSISFCFLIWSRGRSINLNEHLTPSLLMTAPKMNGFWATRSLVVDLEKRIDEAWKKELSFAQPLTYLLGVSRKGAIVDCVPANQASTTFIDKTPLPLLMQSVDSNIKSQFPLARIQVTFDAVGHLKIQNCRSVSILEMACILSFLGLLISSKPTWWTILRY
jgi:hypothetical protein